MPLVNSINVSGHKYGLVYAGVGWNIWRSAEYLPADLVFHINYLGSEQASFTLNFSKSAANIIAQVYLYSGEWYHADSLECTTLRVFQYYVLLRLGRDGFTAIMHNLVSCADRLAKFLKDSGRFVVLSECGLRALPVVAFRLKRHDEGGDKFIKGSEDDSDDYAFVPLHFDEYDVAHRLRDHGWIVPA